MNNIFLTLIQLSYLNTNPTITFIIFQNTKSENEQKSNYTPLKILQTWASWQVLVWLTPKDSLRDDKTRVSLLHHSVQVGDLVNKREMCLVIVQYHHSESLYSRSFNVCNQLCSQPSSPCHGWFQKEIGQECWSLILVRIHWNNFMNIRSLFLKQTYFVLKNRSLDNIISSHLWRWK